MFDHVLVRVADRTASEAFYGTVLATLQVDSFRPLPAITRWENFGIIERDGEHPATTALHVGFAAPSRERVDAFWKAGIGAGHMSVGAPGPRPEYGEAYYGAFLMDPDGNSIEAVHDGDLAGDGLIDHLWIRVSDLRASTRFYATIAPHTGLTQTTDTPDRVGFTADGGSLALVAGPPTTHLHVAFSAETDDAVNAFHAGAVAADFRSNGAPGERPEYEPGYYGAFVLDPDGLNVEAVHHNPPGP